MGTEAGRNILCCDRSRRKFPFKNRDPTRRCLKNLAKGFRVQIRLSRSLPWASIAAILKWPTNTVRDSMNFTRQGHGKLPLIPKPSPKHRDCFPKWETARCHFEGTHIVADEALYVRAYRVALRTFELLALRSANSLPQTTLSVSQ